MSAPRLLRRYLASRYIIAILGTFLLCSLLIFMIDFVEMLRQSGKYGSVSGLILIKLTLLRLPAYTELLLGFAVQVGCIFTLLMLNRKSELAVMRAAGMSVWQFLRPAIVIAIVMGTLAVTVYNPLAAAGRAEAERLFAEVFGRESSLLQSQASGAWLRQDGADGSSVLSAGAVSNKGLALTAVNIIQYDRDGHFVERVEGARARLREGFWQVEQAWISRVGQPPEKYESYLVSTYLSPERVQDALGSALAISFWELPGLIEATEKAGLSAANFRMQYELLLSRPVLLIAMVFLGATVSLRSFRSGGIQTMVITGMVAGLGFLLLLEVSRQIGISGLVAPRVAVWFPVVVAVLLAVSVLLRQEDG